MLPMIQMKGVTKRFGTLLANDQIDFDLYPGETHALVGENGAGKTTLMRILYGQYTPDEGEISIDGKPCSYRIAGAMKHGIAMVHQNFMQIERMSILENIIMAAPPAKGGFIQYRRAEAEVKELLDRFLLSASPGTQIGALCVGERQKVEIIKALYLGARVLILDEPTAVLMEVGDRITVMRGGRISQNFRRGEVDETDIARAMIGKKEISLLKNTIHDKPGPAICSAKNLWYVDGSGVARLQDFSMDIHAGEILGIGGVEGNGQTELIDLLVGMKRASSGQVSLDGQDITRADIRTRREAGIGYVSEDRMNVGLCLDADLNENMICGREQARPFSHRGLLRPSQIAAYVRETAAHFDIRGVGEKGRIKGMSGGNLQKIVLAREISRGPKLLIAAQPTRGLDIGAINFVRARLLEEKKRGTAILLVSADMEELMSLSDRILIMCAGACTGEVTDIASATEEMLGLMMGGITNSAKKEADHA